MTVTAKTTWVQYTGTGSVDTYDYDWRVLDEGDLVVVQTDTDGTDTTLALTTDYTVTGVDDVDGGTVVLTSPLASGYTLTIYMEMDITQPLDLTNQDAFFLEGIETGLDRLALQQQQLNTSLARCVQLPTTSGGTGDELGDLLLAVEDYTDRAESAATSAEADAATASAAVGRLTYTETVTGTSKTAFDLPFNYEYADDAITVFIDGVYQHPDSYTCTDANTVTMDDAVEVGQVVTFMSSTLGTPDLGTNFADLTLSNLSSTTTARTNLGLGTAATVNTGTGSTQVPTNSALGELAYMDENDLNFTPNPAGTIITFAAETPPTGYLECNGAAISRTTYADLYSVIGITHGYGDNSTTFNIPDYRGRFLRGWDHGIARDPDRASRTAMATGGKTGDHVGTVQTDQYKSHTHSGARVSGSYFTVSGPDSYLNWGASGASGGNETRPLNANVMYCIKY